MSKHPQNSLSDYSFKLNCDIQVAEGHQDISDIVNEWHPDLIMLIQEEPTIHEVDETEEGQLFIAFGSF